MTPEVPKRVYATQGSFPELMEAQSRSHTDSATITTLHTQEGPMSRRIRLLAFALLASVAIGAAACANPVAPLDNCGGEDSACFNAGYTNSDT